MNAQLILGFLNALLAIIPTITNSKAINQFVAWLLQIEPTIVQFSQELGPVISNIVAAFAANPATTPAQMAVLKQLDATVDKAFDDAFTDYLANHPNPVTTAVSTAASLVSAPIPTTSIAEDIPSLPLPSAG